MRCSVLFYFLFGSLLFSLTAFGQPGLPADSTNTIIVGEIFLEGNKKTRDAILLRELPFKSGERYSLSELVKRFEKARRQLLNTALFTEVVVAAKNISGETINIIVEVKERWYIFPVPYFRPVDRNLNQWLVEQKASLDRINYGIKFYHNNTTGNNDKLRVGISGGYTRQLVLSYDRLYIDKKMKWGMKLHYSSGKNHEINYNTINDKQAFLKDEENYTRFFSNSSVQFTYRPKIKTRHSFGIGFTTERISDTVLKSNPHYFRRGKKQNGFPGIYYNLTYYDLDYIPYPTKGYALDLVVGKSGFNKDINLLQLHVKALAYYPVARKTFLSLNYFGGVKLPFRQPFFNQRMFGYGDTYMQGFEYFVVDGAAGTFLKAGLNRELLAVKFKSPTVKKGSVSPVLPFRIVGKIFGNTGYVYNPEPGENLLSNRMLWSGGVGIDIVILYDITFKLEWSFNSIGQNGLFLHRKSIF